MTQISHPLQSAPRTPARPAMAFGRQLGPAANDPGYGNLQDLPFNPMLDTDGYKPSHHLQYPPGTDMITDYLESRGGEFDKTQFFGLQHLVKRYLTTKVTPQMVEEADKFYKKYYGANYFNKDLWMNVATKLDGKIPLEIRAVKQEGALVPKSNVLLTVTNTKPGYHSLVGWFETNLMRIWYPISVATQSFYGKRIIMDYLQKTSDNPAAVLPYMLHDFGARGVSSRESAAVGGMAHLINFDGSDTVEAARQANHWYKVDDDYMAAHSLAAAEHSTMTSWGRDGEVDAYRNMLKQFAKPGAVLAVVSDSYDYYNAVRNIWGEVLRQEVIDSGATLVIRPDSGDPVKVICDSLKILEEKYGVTQNAKGYKVLKNVKVIQGDGIDIHDMDRILKAATDLGYSADNLVFGMGGGLLQKVNRDTHKFAIKASAARINGKWFDVFKDPITDQVKKSKRGHLDLIKENGQFKTVRTENEAENFIHPNSELTTYFRDGVGYNFQTFAQVRETANQALIEELKNPRPLPHVEIPTDAEPTFISRLLSPIKPQLKSFGEWLQRLAA